MTTIALRFLAHRFHATPWGRHVNEGTPEWPPSPYRVLRALYDSWKRKQPELGEVRVADVLRALAAEAPRFALPPATASHTRSYLSSNTLDPNDKSLIFDAFVALEPGAACYLTWAGVTLTADQRKTLEQLLGSLNYLGRSESWVEAGLFDGEIDAPIRCEPLNGSGQAGEPVPVACVLPESEYRGERPWMEAVACSTTEFLKDSRSLPPAMRMVQYARPFNALSTRVTRRPQRHTVFPQAVLLWLDAKVLPLVTATIEVAEKARARLMGIHKRLMGDAGKVSRKFSGKTANGIPLCGHRHAFILPLGNQRGRIDRILIYTRSEEGFDSAELQAILQLRSLWWGGSDRPIGCVATWQGRWGQGFPWQQSRQIVSLTPFITARHWRKGRGSVEEFLQEEVRRECGNHGLPVPVAVGQLRTAVGLFEWVEYRRNRTGDPPAAGYGFRLEFAEPVTVPFSLGYGCHFGLGQFGEAS